MHFLGCNNASQFFPPCRAIWAMPMMGCGSRRPPELPPTPTSSPVAVLVSVQFTQKRTLCSAAGQPSLPPPSSTICCPLPQSRLRPNHTLRKPIVVHSQLNFHLESPGISVVRHAPPFTLTLPSKNRSRILGPGAQLFFATYTR